MNSRQAPPDPSLAADPAPTPPVEPALEDCCGSGCVPCIFDIYEQERERYQEALAAWNARQKKRPGRR